MLYPSTMPETPPTPPSMIDQVPGGKKSFYAGIGVLGVLGAALAGWVTITTPEAQACQIELADAKARLELLTEAKDACKDALDSFMAREDDR